MSPFLSPTTFLVKIGADVVVLDARSNAYFCLPGGAEGLRIQEDQVTFSDPDLAETFEDAGFLSQMPGTLPSSGMSRPTRDLGVAVAERVAIGDLVLILGGWLWMFAAYHGRPFDRLLKTARQGRKRAPTARRPPRSSAWSPPSSGSCRGCRSKASASIAPSS